MPEARLMRSKSDRVFLGVCGGIAAYLGIDSVFVRLAFVVLALASGIGVILYLVLMVIMPNETNVESPPSKVVQDNLEQFGSDFGSGVKRVRQHPRGPTIAAGLLILMGIYLLTDNFNFLSWINGTVLVSLAFIGMGIYLIARRNK